MFHKSYFLRRKFIENCIHNEIKKNSNIIKLTDLKMVGMSARKLSIEKQQLLAIIRFGNKINLLLLDEP